MSPARTDLRVSAGRAAVRASQAAQDAAQLIVDNRVAEALETLNEASRNLATARRHLRGRA